jgi:hypothetical protein
MIYIRLSDRLGNQMFQYAAARALAERNHTTVQVDVSAYRHPRVWHNYQLWRFPRLGLRPLFPQSIAQFGHTLGWKRKSPGTQFAMKGLGFDPSVNRLPDSTSLHGYFSSEQYFSDRANLIRWLFDLRDFLNPNDTMQLSSQIAKRTAVSVHIRRGDYVGNSLFDIGDLKRYYQRSLLEAIRIIPDAYFVVVSDDPAWCLRWQVLKDFDAHVIRGLQLKSPFQDLALISWCHHHIISNSTFAWWGAWLSSNPRKHVFMPSRWLSQWTTKECGLDVAGWTQVEP